MQIGVTYPQTEIEPDPGAVRHFTQAVESMGFRHVLAYDHVIGANTASRPGWNRPYSLESSFIEPFVLFSHMAAISSTLGFVTRVLVLTQRQTVLVAKQAACLDVLCQGRLRVGIGTGWNEVEYEALGMPFAARGARIEEQVAVLRALWSQDAVTFNGGQHTITDAGLNPLPVQQPIPIWFGGGSDRPQIDGKPASMKVLRRIARLADGWIPQAMPVDRGRELFGIFHDLCREYGRDPRMVGIEARLDAMTANESQWAEEAAVWRDLGASHLSICTVRDGLQGVDAHLKRLEAVRRVIPADE